MNAFLNILNNPAQPIKQEFGWLERHTIVKAIEEKINDAFVEYDNKEQHTKTIDVWNEWLHWLNEMWDGKLNYTFEQWADTIGIQKYELYKMIIGIVLDKHLDSFEKLSPFETNVDNDMLNNVMGMDVLNELNGLTIRNDSRINRDE